MKYINKLSLTLASASGNNPVLVVATTLLFYVFFNLIEGQIETLLFGDRFEHWLDPLFASCFMVLAAHAVWMCAALEVHDKSK